VPRFAVVAVEVAELPEATRELLLELGGGNYLHNKHDHHDLHAVCCDADGNGLASTRNLTYWQYGYVSPLCYDGEAPTVADVAAMLSAAASEATAQARRKAAKQLAEEAQRAREEEAKRQRQEALTAARELLKDELATREKECRDAIGDCRILGKFLAEVPQDALRGALKSLAAKQQGASVKSLRKRVEDASPVWIFRDEDEDEDEDEDDC
jgi:GAF domain-containing protein